MTKEDEASKCKLRFKGVENFLRRVAFNLGNTPSQTEVKIISCIPIDVSDLQQKIVQLEKQLEDSRKAREDKDKVEKNGKETTEDDSQKPENEEPKPPTESSKQTSIVQTAIYRNALPRFSRPANRTDNFDYYISDNTGFFDDSSSKQRKPAASFIFSAIPSTKVINSSSQSKQSKLINGGDYSTITKGIRQKIFRKTKRLPNKRVNSQLVYYAKTNGTPFVSHDITHTVKSIGCKESDLISKSYLFDMIRKQYKSNKVIYELSKTSYFISPICKDGEQEFQRHYETDTCSCCHGTFQNIDDYLSKTRFNTDSALTFNGNDNQNTYYDSSLYDLIPVKEKPAKSKKEFDSTNRKEPKIDIKCWPENVRIKSRPKPNVMNYQTTIHDKNICTKKPIAQINKPKDNNTLISIKLTKNANKLDQQTRMETSKNCFIDLGTLKTTKQTKKLKTIKLSEKAIPLVKNVECLTNTINHSECQTSTLNPMTKASDNKTENTLNQIKCILQSVLTEIKTTSQLKGNQEDSKKDATVQNEVYQNDIHDRSCLLNSFTYSSYNIDPYRPSYSKPMSSNFFCYARLPHPVNCMQNYPLIIQGTERQLCTGCFRSSHIKTHKNIAKTATTNTEQFCEHRNNETEKLIKEIYKSIALDIPRKDTSLSEYDELKSVKATTRSSNCSKENKQVSVVVSELFTNKNVQIESSRTNDTNSSIRTKTLKSDSTQSHVTSTDTGTDNQITDENITHLLTNRSVQQTTETEPQTEKETKSFRTESKRKPPSTVSESSESEEPSETESIEANISAKETQIKKKTGFFCRMFEIFSKNKKTNNLKNDNESEESNTSDSDDYQTIYSHKSEIPKHDKTINRKSRPHSKILLSRRLRHRRRSPEKPRSTPYMEQEYRRLWNEKLMFHNRKQKYSSEEPFRMEIEPRMRHKHPYDQNYEARAALVDPGILYRKRFIHQDGNSTNAPDNFVNRSRFGQQLNPISYTSNDKYKIEDNARFTVPISAFNRNGYQKTSPTFLNTKQEQFNEPKTSRNKTQVHTKPKGMQWLRNHKMGIHCGQQWKQLLLES